MLLWNAKPDFIEKCDFHSQRSLNLYARNRVRHFFPLSFRDVYVRIRLRIHRFLLVGVSLIIWLVSKKCQHVYVRVILICILMRFQSAYTCNVITRLCLLSLEYKFWIFSTLWRTSCPMVTIPSLIRRDVIVIQFYWGSLLCVRSLAKNWCRKCIVRLFSITRSLENIIASTYTCGACCCVCTFSRFLLRSRMKGLRERESVSVTTQIKHLGNFTENFRTDYIFENRAVVNFRRNRHRHGNSNLK